MNDSVDSQYISLSEFLKVNGRGKSIEEFEQLLQDQADERGLEKSTELQAMYYTGYDKCREILKEELDQAKEELRSARAELEEVRGDIQRKTSYWAFMLGVPMMVGAVAVLLFNEYINTRAYEYTSMIFALGAAGFGLGLTGTIEVNINNWLKATGALGLAIAVYCLFVYAGPENSPNDINNIQFEREPVGVVD